jgi:endonuclease/exonuclease/phosphatase family metal-dependent hydrolase
MSSSGSVVGSRILLRPCTQSLTDMPLKLLTLNIEGDRHLDEVCSAIGVYLPHIVCLQEVLEADCARLAAIGGYQVKHAVTTRMPLGAKGGIRNWGDAVLTRVPLQDQTVTCYAADSRIRVFRQPTDPRPALIATELEHDGQTYRIATTHFTWSSNGQATDEQYEDFGRLKQALAAYPHYVLCGDFNAPRRGEMFAKFTDELSLIDHLPPSVTSTIDPKFHYAGALQLVVDTIFSTPHYQVCDVRILEGISDHKGVLASVRRRATHTW